MNFNFHHYVHIDPQAMAYLRSIDGKLDAALALLRAMPTGHLTPDEQTGLNQIFERATASSQKLDAALPQK